MLSSTRLRNLKERLFNRLWVLTEQVTGMGERASAVRVARGASYLWMQTLITTLIGIVGFAIIARLISTSQMGLLAILSLVLSLGQLVAPLALPSAVVRFVAEELAQGRRQNAAGVLYQSAKMSIALSSIFAAACFLLASYLSAVLSAEPIVFELLAIDIFLTAGFIQTFANGLIGAQRIRDYSFATITNAVLRQTLIAGLLLLFHDFMWLVCAWVISDFVYVLMIMTFTLRALGPPRFEFSLKRLLRFSLPMMPALSLSFIYSWFDKAFLVAYASLAQLGIYNATLTAWGVLSTISGGIITSLYPTYAEIQSLKGKAGLQDAIHVASRYISFIAIPAALGLLAIAKPALSLFAGEPYESGSAALQILVLFSALTVLNDSIGNIFQLLGKTATYSVTSAASVAASVLTAMLLVPIYGINAAAASRGVALLTSFGLTLGFVRRETKLSFDLEAFWKSLAASVGMVIAVWLAQQASYNRLLLPAYVILGTLAYLVGLRLLKAIHPADTELAKQVLGKRYEFAINFLSKILQT
jgi:O-antigen/teichoic acid export membrane protein